MPDLPPTTGHFEAIQMPDGWSVLDSVTGQVALLGVEPQCRLRETAARALANSLNDFKSWHRPQASQACRIASGAP